MLTRTERLAADRLRIAGILWCHDPKTIGMGDSFPGDEYDSYAAPIQFCTSRAELQKCLEAKGLYTPSLLQSLLMYLAI